MSFTTKFAAGYSGSAVAFVNSDEFAWICGNCLVLHSVFSGSQRILQGPGLGIQCFAANATHELIAVIEKGVRPKLHVYSAADLSEIGALKLDAELGYTAVSFSADGERLAVCSEEPDSSLAVYIWREAQQVVHAQIPKPARQVSFHPYDPDRLCTTGFGEQIVWKIVKLWQKYDFVPENVRIPGYEPSCHAWYPQGLYQGCTTGEVFALDAKTLQPHTYHTDEGAELPVMVNASPDRLPITAIALNRDCMIVGTPGTQVTWFTHGAPNEHFEKINEVSLASHGTAALEAGGQDYSKTVIGTLDSKICLAELVMSSSSGQVSLNLSTLADCHVGHIAGVAAHPAGGHVLTTGADGTLRVWEIEGDLKMVSKRTFSSAQTAITTCRVKPLAALGSETGVIRLVSLTDVTKLSVLHRSRLHTAPLHLLAFNPKGDMLISVARDHSVCFMAVLGPSHHLSVIGYTTAPEGVLSVTWPSVMGGEDNVLLSLASGGMTSLMAPAHLLPGTVDDATAAALAANEYLLNVRDVQSKTIKLEVPMLKVAGVPGEKYGVVYGLGADRQLHRVVLPAEGSSWAGLKGRLHKSSLKVQAHGKADGGVCVSASGTLIATCSVDGSVSLRNEKLQVEGSQFDVMVHDLFTGGASGIAFEPTGVHFVSCGADGTLFVFSAHSYGERHISAPPKMSSSGAISHDLDDLDDINEYSWLDMLKQRAAAAAVTAAAATSSFSNPAETRAKLGLLRKQLHEAMVMNSHAPELEQLDPSTFIIHQELVEELKGLGDQRIQSVAEGVRREMLRLELVTERLSEVLLNSMSTKGAAVGALRSPVVVHNFATRPSKNKVLNQVAFLRKVEMVEQRQLGWVDGSKAYRIKLDDHGNVVDPATVVTEQVDPAAELESLLNCNPSEDSVDMLLYCDFDVYCPTRKVIQIHLMRQKMTELREQFNKDFAQILKTKKVDVEKMVDLQARIDEISKELVVLGGSTLVTGTEERFVPRVLPEENLDQAVGVRDEDIKIEKYLTEEERARQEEKTRAEEAAMRKSLADNTGERALKAMMGGTLESTNEMEDEFSLLRPEWMDGNPKDFTEEQLREVKEFQAKEKVMAEERAKKKTRLETELRSLRAHLEEAVTKFDDAINTLHHKRIKALGEIRALESRKIGLALNFESFQAVSDKAEKALILKMTHFKELKQNVSTQLQEFRDMLAEQSEKLAGLTADDKQLDRNFKKEFAECDYYYNRLLQLYKYRAKTLSAGPRPTEAMSDTMKRESLLGGQAPSDHPDHQSVIMSEADGSLMMMGGVKESETGESMSVRMSVNGVVVTGNGVAPAGADTGLDPWPKARMLKGDTSDESEQLPPRMCPEGLPEQWWDKFVEYRAAKIRTERGQREAQHSVATIQNQVLKLEAQEAQHSLAVDSIMSQMSQLRASRKKTLFDVETQLRLKQGQVETEPEVEISCDMSHAVFVHRSVVEDVNAVVRHRGGKKVDTLRAIKDFKKGIYELQWSNTRLAMQATDLGDKTRELQLLHVTKDFQQLLKTGEDKSTNPQEANNLESLMRARELLHMKNIDERKKRLNHMASEARHKHQQNEEVQVHLVGLQKVLEDQTRIQSSMQTVDEQTTRRMRNLVTHKKLKEIAKQQMDEIARLKKEMDDLHLRTFPSFVEQRILLPDARYTKGHAAY